VDVESHRELKVLEAISANERTTQRGLASQLGIALGLANLYLKRLARKGYIKCVNVQSNRVRYLITPKGIAEKTRLTYEFMEYSLRVFRETRTHLKAMLKPYVSQASVRLAIYGTGEAAELACLCLKELGLEPVAVFDGEGRGRFFGLPIRPLSEHDKVAFDALIVASLTDPTPLLQSLKAAGVEPSKLVTLRDPANG
jgi:DNA-binding MarR family transcriptional regulator